MAKNTWGFIQKKYRQPDHYDNFFSYCNAIYYAPSGQEYMIEARPSLLCSEKWGADIDHYEIIKREPDCRRTVATDIKTQKKAMEILIRCMANDLKQYHDKYNNTRGTWDGQRMHDIYTLDKLALHLLLENEVFYLRNDETTGKALMYLQDAYPEATIDDLNRAYDKYSDLVTMIYG